MNTEIVEHYAYSAYSRYAMYLLDDIFVSILFGFDEDDCSKSTFSNFLQLFMLVHVSRMTVTACWFCREKNKYIVKLEAIRVSYQELQRL